MSDLTYLHISKTSHRIRRRQRNATAIFLVLILAIKSRRTFVFCSLKWASC
jgi:hypothetical protein